MAQMRQSRPDSGSGFQGKVLKSLRCFHFSHKWAPIADEAIIFAPDQGKALPDRGHREVCPMAPCQYDCSAMAERFSGSNASSVGMGKRLKENRISQRHSRTTTTKCLTGLPKVNAFCKAGVFNSQESRHTPSTSLVWKYQVPEHFD